MGERRHRVAYAGDDSFVTCLQALVDRADVELVLCLTAADHRYTTTVTGLAADHGAPVIAGHPGPEGWRALDGVGADLLITAAYGPRIPVEDLQIETMINVHPSYLPHGRGPNPLVHLAGCESGLQADHAGVTIHLLEREFDTGPILIQERFEQLPPGAGLMDLTLAALGLAPILLNRLLDDLPAMVADATVQVGGSYWPPMTPSALIIDLTSATDDEILSAIDRYSGQGFAVRLEDRTTVELETGHFTSVPHCFKAGRELGRLRGDYIFSAPGGLVRGLPFRS